MLRHFTELSYQLSLKTRNPRTSKWARWRLRSPALRFFTQPFVRAQIKENTKAPRHWPLCGEFTGEAQWRICASGEHVIIGSDYSLPPIRHQAIIWTNVALLSVGTYGRTLGEILIEIQMFSFRKMHLKIPSAKIAAILSRPECVNCSDGYLSL